jgi:hypothetical protein
LQQGRGQILAAWIEALPPAVRDVEPWLDYWLGVAQLPVQPAECRIALEAAYFRFKSSGDDCWWLMAWCALMDSFSYEWGNFRLLDRWLLEVGIS